MHSEPDHEVET